MRSSSAGSPTASAGTHRNTVRRFRASASTRTAFHADSTTAERSTGSRTASPIPSVRASSSSADTNCSARSPAARTTPAMRRSSSTSASGSDSVTSSSVRTTERGVRSSCDAFATNRRCESKAASRRSSIASNVSASSATSSRGPSSRNREPSDSADNRRAAPVTSCRGFNTRPVNVHASTAAATTMHANAMSPACSRSRRAAAVSALVSTATSTLTPSTVTWLPDGNDGDESKTRPTSVHPRKSSTALTTATSAVVRSVIRRRSPGPRLLTISVLKIRLQLVRSKHSAPGNRSRRRCR